MQGIRLPLCLCVLWLSASFAIPQENLMSNGSFEAVSQQGIPTGWRLNPRDVSAGTVIVATDAACNHRDTESTENCNGWTRCDRRDAENAENPSTRSGPAATAEWAIRR